MALSPCFIPGSDDYVKDLTPELYAQISAICEIMGIESLFGPDWEEQKQKMCNLLQNDSEWCEYLESIPVGPIAGGYLYNDEPLTRNVLSALDPGTFRTLLISEASRPRTPAAAS